MFQYTTSMIINKTSIDDLIVDTRIKVSYAWHTNQLGYQQLILITLIMRHHSIIRSNAVNDKNTRTCNYHTRKIFQYDTSILITESQNYFRKVFLPNKLDITIYMIHIDNLNKNFHNILVRSWLKWHISI